MNCVVLSVRQFDVTDVNVAVYVKGEKEYTGTDSVVDTIANMDRPVNHVFVEYVNRLLYKCASTVDIDDVSQISWR